MNTKKSQETTGKNQREGEGNGQGEKKEGTGICGKKENWEESEGLEGKGWVRNMEKAREETGKRVREREHGFSFLSHQWALKSWTGHFKNKDLKN